MHNEDAFNESRETLNTEGRNKLNMSTWKPLKKEREKITTYCEFQCLQNVIIEDIKEVEKKEEGEVIFLVS